VLSDALGTTYVSHGCFHHRRDSRSSQRDRERSLTP
jgi:hypothetical protein